MNIGVNIATKNGNIQNICLSAMTAAVSRGSADVRHTNHIPRPQSPHKRDTETDRTTVRALKREATACSAI